MATNTVLDPKDEKYNWKDQGIVIESIPNRDLWNAIDPNLIIDENDTPWLAFGSFWDGLKLVKLNKNLTEIAQPQKWHTIARRERNFELADSDPGNAALEAPFIFKKNDYYYLFLSWDLCCRGENSTYKVVVGRSKDVTVPYVDKSGKELNNGAALYWLKEMLTGTVQVTTAPIHLMGKIISSFTLMMQRITARQNLKFPNWNGMMAGLN